MNSVHKKGKNCSIYIHLINNHQNGSLAFSIQIILAHNKKHTTTIKKLKEQPKSSQTLLLISSLVPCCMAGSKHRA